MASRPRTGRGVTSRDGTKDVDVEATLLAQVLDGLRKAKEQNDSSRTTGQEIVALEKEIKDQEESTPEQHKRLDALYRELLRYAEQEKRVHDDDDIVNNLAIMATMRSTDEPTPRNGHPPKSRKNQRPAVDPEAVADSPGPSPSDGRIEMIKRVKGTSQRSSSVASQGRTAAVKEDSAEHNRGILAERAGHLVVGTDVFYKYPKGQLEQEEGIGIHGIIKKVWHDRKPIQYEVRDPEDDPTGKQTVRKATAKDLVPIPQAPTNLPPFTTGSNVFAKYPDTDTFYKAKVRNFQKGMYTLKFEGEEDDKEMAVDKRFVLDSRLK